MDNITVLYLSTIKFLSVSRKKSTNRITCDVCGNRVRIVALYSNLSATYSLCVDCDYEFNRIFQPEGIILNSVFNGL